MAPAPVPGPPGRTTVTENPGVDVDADRLTPVLASRLAAIVPEGFQVEASGGMLRYSADHARFPGQRLWYGEPGRGGRVVLRCDPIPLADIQPGR